MCPQTNYPKVSEGPTKKADASNSDATAAVAAAKTALSPSVTITAFNSGTSTRSDYAVADAPPLMMVSLSKFQLE